MKMWKASGNGAQFWVIAESSRGADEILRECYPDEYIGSGDPLSWRELLFNEKFTYHFGDGRTVTLEASQWCDLMYTSAGFVACSEW